MKKYLVRWNESGKVHSAVFNAFGILRLMRRAHEEKANYHVNVYSLSEEDVYMPPVGIRVYYDWKYDKLSLFSLSGFLVDKAEGKIPEGLMRSMTA